MFRLSENTIFLGKFLFEPEECTSTNTMLLEMVRESIAHIPEGTVVITPRQTAGRGQRGNKWESAAGKNLTFSFVLYPEFLDVRNQFQLNLAVSVGLFKAVKKVLIASGFSIDDLKIKWPNDLYIKNIKIAGMLIETGFGEGKWKQAICGIGLNINQQQFESPKAGSLFSLTGKKQNLQEIFEWICQEVEQSYLELKETGEELLKDYYLSVLYGKDEKRTFRLADKDTFMEAIIRGVDERGRLLAETDGALLAYEHKTLIFT